MVAGYANRDLIRIKIKSVYARVSPKPLEPERGGSRNPNAFYGSGSWALSALPECWEQQAKATGNVAYVRAHLPPGSQRVTRGTNVTAQDCSLTVRGEDAEVHRGGDTIVLPAPTEIYVSADRLSILHLQGNSAELRTYSKTP